MSLQYGLHGLERNGERPTNDVPPFRLQLLKWVGNKQRFAHEIISWFPERYGTYVEPFVGSGAVLGTLAPASAIASDALGPLVDLWQTVAANPQTAKSWYRDRWQAMRELGKLPAYEVVKADYNRSPNAADLLFISRSCYGGVVRFRRDGVISTPCGAHEPISPESFAHRIDVWHDRISTTAFHHADFEQVMDAARPGDLVYCDPPYTHTQAILYGAQRFSLERLIGCIERCKSRGVKVVLSIDGTKKSGNVLCELPLPKSLFEREALVNVGRSMLRRFQMKGETLEGEVVRDRLLLTY